MVKRNELDSSVPYYNYENRTSGMNGQTKGIEQTDDGTKSTRFLTTTPETGQAVRMVERYEIGQTDDGTKLTLFPTITMCAREW